MGNAVVLFLLGILAAGQVFSEESSTMQFIQPSFLSSKKNLCSAKTVSSSLSPDARAISVLLRTDKLLEVGQGKAERTRMDCEFNLVFNKPLIKTESIHIDLRGAELKDSQARLHYTFSIGKQRHSFEYAEGRILDSQDSSFVRRFELSDIPAGTQKIRVRLKGSARTKASGVVSWLAVDSLDACFLDVAKPDGCGAIAAPQPQK